MRLKHAVWMGLGVYVLLSVTDWVMTSTLLRAHPGAVEANPLAAACLKHFGWNGLALYKATGVLVFVGALVFVANRRPVVASLVTAGGCAVLLAVTIYSHRLLVAAHRDAVECAPWPKAARSAPADGVPVPISDKCWFGPKAPATATATLRK